MIKRQITVLKRQTIDEYRLKQENASNTLKTANKAQSQSINWLSESIENIKTAKLNDSKLGFAYFGK